MVRRNSRWIRNGWRMWVLPKPWDPPRKFQADFPRSHQPGWFLCMVEGYDRKLVWMPAEEIERDWRPHHFKKDTTRLPRWLVKGVHIHWKVNDTREIQGEVTYLNTKTGWGIVVCMTNLKDHSEKDYKASVSHRHGGFIWCEQVYSMFFCRSSDLLTGVRPMYQARRSVWDILGDRTAWAV